MEQKIHKSNKLSTALRYIEFLDPKIMQWVWINKVNFFSKVSTKKFHFVG